MGILSGITSKTPEKVLLHAGAFFANMDAADYNTVAELKAAMKAAYNNTGTGARCLGATRGGGTFQPGITMRQMEADGARGRVKGLEEIDEILPHLTTTLLEIDPANMSIAVFAADTSKNGEKTTVTPRYDVKASDYIDALTWVGQIKGGGYAAITLYNTINTSTSGITFNDKNEATLPVDFVGETDGIDEMLDWDKPPYAIAYFQPDGTLSPAQPETQQT